MDEVGLTDNVVEMVTERKDVCPFCEEETVVPAWRKKIVHHLVITVDSDNALHIHGPIDNIETMGMLINGTKHELAKIIKDGAK